MNSAHVGTYHEPASLSGSRYLLRPGWWSRQEADGACLPNPTHQHSYSYSHQTRLDSSNPIFIMTYAMMYAIIYAMISRSTIAPDAIIYSHHNSIFSCLPNNAARNTMALITP